MSTLPLEVHEVLEEEYVSMYGPLPLLEHGAHYTEEQLLDGSWALRILVECELVEGTVIEALNALIDDGSATRLRKLANSPCISSAGKAVLDDYDEYTQNVTPQRRAEIHRRVIDDAFTGAVKPLRDVRLGKVYEALHARAKENKPRTALCISGGGIRSATFALGVIQGLAGAKLLEKFDYLSTVSGGGYIGSWLSSWIRRNGRGVSGVQDELQRADTAVAASRAAITDNIVRPTETVARPVPSSKIDPEPEPLRHLRSYSNYLSPRLGIFSGDTWTLAALYIRNLLLNLLVLVPLLACALALPRAFSWVLAHEAVWPPAAWAWGWAAFVTIGFAYIGKKRPVEQGEKAQRKAGTATSDVAFLFGCVAGLTLSGVALAVFWARIQGHVLENLRAPETWTAFAAALLGMTAVPYVLYYRRWKKALPAERRTSFAEDAAFRAELRKKRRAELIAVVVAVLTSAALLVLIAKKVFDQPVRAVPTVATLAPIDRAGQPSWPEGQLYVCFIVPMLLLVYFVQASIFVGLSSWHNADSDREWWGRAGGWLIAVSALMAAFSAIAVFGPVAFYYAPAILGSIGGAAGLISVLVGGSDKTAANDKQKSQETSAQKAGRIASTLAVPIFVIALLSVISLGSTWLIQQFQNANDQRLVHLDDPAYAQMAILQANYTRTEAAPPGVTRQLKTTPSPRVEMPALRTVAHLQTIQYTSGVQLAIFLAVAVLGFLLSLCIGVNKFSMQALYRNRIIRAYLGASRYARDPDRFTGFDENDNLQMWELRPEVLWTSSLRDIPGFITALRDPNNALGVYLWRALDAKTRSAITTELNAISIDSLIQNLNSILISDKHDLANVEGVKPPKWVSPTEEQTQIAYPQVLRNRATLDFYFAEWVNPMTPPVDVAAAPANAVPRGPLHVVNCALNLTSGDHLAWQERMAESFTATPYHAGSLYLGYRPVHRYGGSDGISLGTAVAISGAAASPNMGYNSSPLVAFLLTFFNVRLGSWLGNPGVHGRASFGEAHPTSGLLPMLEELTGNSDDQSKWVYLSDGGHFENLALYEMVLRRCHKIIVSDAGADPKCVFDDLGNAIRKIRIDLGVPIDIENINMFPRADNGLPVKGEYVAYGTIRYSAVDEHAEDGELVYIKPGFYDEEFFPRDVYNYSLQSRQFPHEPTSDQFFSESQFESYRALGRHVMTILSRNERVPVSASGPRIPIQKTYATVAEFVKTIRPQRPQTPTLNP